MDNGNFNNGNYNNNGNFNNNYNMPPQQPQYSQYPQKPQGGTDGKAIASLVLGIVGIVVGCFFGLLGVVVGIVGLVLGIMSNKQMKSGMALAGIILNSVCIVWSVISWIIGIIALSKLNDMGFYY